MLWLLLLLSEIFQRANVLFYVGATDVLPEPFSDGEGWGFICTG